MNLLDLLEKAGGKQSLDSVAGKLGIDSSSTSDLVSALAPALMGGLQKQTRTSGGLSNLQNALKKGSHQQYLDNPDLMCSKDTLKDGNNILGHLLGSKDVSRNVAAQASASTGIDTSIVKQALPLIASLAMGALSKDTNHGQKDASSIGSLLGGLMGGADNKVDVDDVLNMAKKFF